MTENKASCRKRHEEISFNPLNFHSCPVLRRIVQRLCSYGPCSRFLPLGLSTECKQKRIILPGKSNPSEPSIPPFKLHQCRRRSRPVHESQVNVFHRIAVSSVKAKEDNLWFNWSPLTVPARSSMRKLTSRRGGSSPELTSAAAFRCSVLLYSLQSYISSSVMFVLIVSPKLATCPDTDFYCASFPFAH